MSTRTVLPDGWPRPRGYANGMAGRGELLAIAIIPALVSIARAVFVFDPEFARFVFEIDIFGNHRAITIMCFDLLCALVAILPIVVVFHS